MRSVYNSTFVFPIIELGECVSAHQNHIGTSTGTTIRSATSHQDSLIYTRLPTSMTNLYFTTCMFCANHTFSSDSNQGLHNNSGFIRLDRYAITVPEPPFYTRPDLLLASCYDKIVALFPLISLFYICIDFTH